jgi:hypothetical protein
MKIPLPLLTTLLVACGGSGGSLSGTYMLEGGGTTFTFDPGGTYSVVMFRDTIHGTYRIEGDSVIMIHPNMLYGTDHEAALLQGDMLVAGRRRFIKQ